MRGRSCAGRTVIIAGGSYIEVCRYPNWNRLFGSGIRAAAALQILSPTSALYTYAPSSYRDDVHATVRSLGLGVNITESDQDCVFTWLHPFDLLESPNKRAKRDPIQVTADAVLRFGMVEGSAVVHAKRAVYDPQNETEEFSENGSVADELVMILTEPEILKKAGKRLAEKEERRAVIEAEVAKLIFLYGRRFKFFAILLKDKVGGVSVYVGDEPTPIKTYAAESFFKIGSGDVFAAAFAYAWAERNLNVYAAAEYAARSLAWFVEGGRLPLPHERELPIRICSELPQRVRILGPDTLELGQLLARTDDWLRDQAIDVAFDLIATSTNNAAPTLILLGEEGDTRTIQGLARDTSSSPRTVVYFTGTNTSLVKHYFPSARISDDYTSALFHLLREPLP